MDGRTCVLIVGSDLAELRALRDLAAGVVADDAMLLALEVPEGSTDPELAWGTDRVRIREFGDPDTAALGPPVPEPLSDDGDVWKAIVNAADDHDVDLVVIASPRQGWFRRTFFGSAAKDLLANGEVPVLAVPEPVVEQRRSMHAS